MNIKLTSEQIEELKKDSYLSIDLGDGAYLYYERNSDGTFSYGEICDPKVDKNQQRKSYSFDTEGLQKLIPTKPDDPSWHHNYPLCPTCGTYMIYNFEHCPKCGQELLWSGFTGER